MVQQTNPNIRVSSGIPLNIAATSDTVVGPTVAPILIAAPGVGFRHVLSTLIAGYQNNTATAFGRTLRVTQNGVIIFTVPFFAQAAVNSGLVVAFSSLELAINENESLGVAFGAGDAGVNQSISITYRTISVP